MLLDPSGPCATMLQGFGDPGFKRTLRNNAPGVPFRRPWIQADLAQQCSRGTFSETLDPSGPCATMLQGYIFGPFRRAWIQADFAQQCTRGTFSEALDPGGPCATMLQGTFSETLDPSGPCATMLQGYLFGDPGSKQTLRNNAPGVPFRRPWIQADLAQQCSRGTFSETLDPSGPCATMLQAYLFGDPGSKRTLRNNAPGVPFRTFSETLDPSGPCATMLQGHFFGDPGSKRTLRNNAPGVPFRRPWIQADLAQRCSRGTFSATLDPSGPCATMLQGYLFGDPGSKRTLRNNAPCTFSETLDPSGPCATMLQGYLFSDPGSKRTLRNNAPGVPFRRPWIQADLAQQCSMYLFGDPGSKRTLRNNAPGVPFSQTLDPSGPCAIMLQGYLFGPCATMLQGYLFGDPGSKRTLRNRGTFSEALDPSGPCATMLQGYLFGGPGSKRTLRNNAPGVPFRTLRNNASGVPFRRPWIQADLAQQCSRGTFSETLDPSGPCATMLQGYLFRRPWIQADLAQQCSRGTFSETLDPSGPRATMLQGYLFGDHGSKRTLRNNAPGVPFRTFSETLDPSGPCATMLQGYLFGDPGSKRTLRNNAPGVPFRRPWIQADLAQQCSRGTFSETLDPSGPCATMLQGYLFGDPGSKRTLRNNAPGVPFRRPWIQADLAQ